MTDLDWLLPERALTLAGGDRDDVDPDRWAVCVGAARAFVQHRRAELFKTDEPNVGPDVELGTSMLAMRFYERRTSPLGVGEYSELGGTILRSDPDINRLLRIDSAARFVFGGAAGYVPPVVTP